MTSSQICCNSECRRAGQPLPLTEFHINKARESGRASRCKECLLAYRKRHYQANKARIKAQNKEYRQRNLEVVRAKRQAKKKERRAEYNAYSAKRAASKLNRTPDYADLSSIREFYANCPKGYHVDHIIPLRGESVSGLHVLSNLQYLDSIQNASKGNSYSPYIEDFK